MSKELHFYRWDCKDYLAESQPMSDAQDLYYRRLMDLCALRGGRIDLSDDAVCRAVRARSSTQKRVVLEVLRDFFQGVSGAHSHPLIDRALALHEASSAGGKNRGSKSRASDDMQSEKPNTVKKDLEINEITSRGLGSESQANAKQSVVSSQESVNSKDLKDKDLVAGAPKSVVQVLDWSPLNLTPEHVEAVKAIRKKHGAKGKVSQRVVDTLSQEFAKARAMGFSDEQVISEWDTRGWVAVKADWLVNAIGAPGRAAGSPQTRRLTVAEQRRAENDAMFERLMAEANGQQNDEYAGGFTYEHQ
ncbi:TPA: DUF1376 domain-containing protein [Aeromonas hydrophila]|nr:DUF1376 domain-containing protein [Aeromonas hydrophila]